MLLPPLLFVLLLCCLSRSLIQLSHYSFHCLCVAFPTDFENNKYVLQYFGYLFNILKTILCKYKIKLELRKSPGN